MNDIKLLEKLKDERLELSKKYQRLLKFKQTETFFNLGTKQKILLIDQSEIMLQYEHVLLRRIRLIKDEDSQK